MNKNELVKMIDHTILKADAQSADIKKLCNEAVEYSFHSICINSCWLPYAKSLLQNSKVILCAVVGFPLGACSSIAKVEETKQAILDGATEIDMVINVGFLKSGDLEKVEQDIALVKQACGNNVLKVIIETCLLTDAEKRIACELSKKAGADFVKTSTGFSLAGANIKDIALMRAAVGQDMGVKASGGIRTYDDLIALYEAGANRFGLSASVAIYKECNSK